MNTEHESEEVLTNECIASNEVVAKVTIGEYLRSAREERDLSIKVISQHTKISVTILENIENNCFDNLPSKAYVIGFVKSYSKTIGLNESHCLELLNEAYGTSSLDPVKPAPRPLEGVAPTNSPIESGSNKEIPSQYLTIAGVFVALIILFAIVINTTNKQPNEEMLSEEDTISKEATQTPLVDIKPQEVSQNTPLTEQNEPAEEVVVKANETEDTVKKEVKEPIKESQVEVKPEVKEVEKKVTVDAEKKKEINLKAIPLPLYSVSTDKEAYTHLPENIKASLIEGKQNIFISAVDGDTWITYKSDANDIKKFILHKGRTLLIRGDLVRVFLGNINVAKIFLNNEALSVSSRSGVKSLVFPQENAKDYKLPLFIYPKPGKVITSSDYEESLSN